jgi:putative aldouronate transport system permease protein
MNTVYGKDGNMRTKKTVSYRLTNLVLSFFLLLVAIFCLYPILHVVFASFSDPLRLAQHTGLLLSPLEPTLKGYELAMSYNNIWTGFYNTVKIVVVGTIVNMIITTMAAYAVSRKDVLLGKYMNIICIVTMFFSGGLIPTYLVVKSIGLLDNMLALILPVALSTWNMIILRVSIQGLPVSLLESARMDGASDYVILFRIVIPLIKATLAVIAFYYIVGHWNSWFGAMIYLRSRSKYPLQLILREILISNTSNAANQSNVFDISSLDRYKQLVKYCTTVIVTLPILFIFPFFQKYFVKGVFVGSLKG